MLSIKAALEEHAARTSRVFSGDRKQTVGASEVGQCARKVWYSKFEGEGDADGVLHDRDEDYVDGWGARVRGTVYEDAWWAPAMKARFGDDLLFSGPDQKTLYSDYLSATPDGLVVNQPADALAHLKARSGPVVDIEGDAVAIECKTIDPRVKLDEPKPEHRFQIIVQLGLIRETTNYAPMWGVVAYTDTSFWNEVLEFPVRFDEGVYAVAKERARAIMTASFAEDLRPEGWIAGGKECDFCAFAGPCGLIDQVRLARLKDIKEIDPEIAQAIETKATVVRLAKNNAAAEIAQAREKEVEIKDLLAKAGVRSFKRGAVSVSWSSVKGRPSYDNKALREAAEASGLDLAQFTTVGDPTDRMTITIKS